MEPNFNNNKNMNMNIQNNFNNPQNNGLNNQYYPNHNEMILNNIYQQGDQPYIVHRQPNYIIAANPIQYTPVTAQVMPGVIIVQHQRVSARNLIPVLSINLATWVLILNIFCPGVGTFILACYSEHPCLYICYGLSQMMLAIFLVGWIWAIVLGAMVLSKAIEFRNNRRPVIINSVF
jgi:hypothetical protein